MSRRPRAFNHFCRHFIHNALYIREVLCGLLSLLMLGGIAISHIEQLDLGEALYFAFVTGLSIGYGDISPTTAWGRVISILIGLVGMLFVGITVAIATRALSDAVREDMEFNKSKN